MGVINEKNEELIPGLEELTRSINEIKGYFLTSIHCAGSGHSGGSLSASEIVGTAYLSVMRHKPHDPLWKERDRFYFSAGHKAPLLYTVLGYCGYFPIRETALLRKLDSPFQGHPDMSRVSGVELSCGSLGQGLSVAVGDALAAKLNKQDYTVFCLMGDGEQQEGQIWEAVMEAAHHKLDNLVGIIDKNKLQIDGLVSEVLNIDPLAAKYESFGWHTIECNGHDIGELLDAFEAAEAVKGQPVVIIAETIKGNSISFMENEAGWHGRAPNRKELAAALSELNLENFPAEEMIRYAEEYQGKKDIEIDKTVPAFSKDYWWNSSNNMKVEMKPTRKGFGEALKETNNERVCALGSDISGSICIDEFYKSNPEREKRWFSMGIAEQSVTSVAAGLAKNGMIPFIGTYGVFAAGRSLDQIRTTVSYGNFNVKIAGAHAGISVGPDGATHQALEEIFQISGLPNMTMISTVDSIETKKATSASIEIEGPCYLRYAREATPIVTEEATPFKPGTATIIRYMGKEEDKFTDAFSIVLSSDYKGGNEDITLIATGPVVAESMRASWILKEEFDIEARVINISTIKPLDKDAVITAALDTGIILTIEEHQKGGLGNLVSSAIFTSSKTYGKLILFDMMGIEDRFGTSGKPWELMKYFKLTAEFITAKSVELLKLKKNVSRKVGDGVAL